MCLPILPAWKPTTWPKPLQTSRQKTGNCYCLWFLRTLYWVLPWLDPHHRPSSMTGSKFQKQQFHRQQVLNLVDVHPEKPEMNCIGAVSSYDWWAVLHQHQQDQRISSWKTKRMSGGCCEHHWKNCQVTSESALARTSRPASANLEPRLYSRNSETPTQLRKVYQLHCQGIE